MLAEIADEVWGAEHDLWMNGLVHFRGRMTVVRLPSGGLWLHSVVPIDDALAASLDDLGPVEHIVAPNLMHHMHLSGVVQRYPTATLWGPSSLARKRNDLQFDGELTADAAPQWGDALEVAHVHGAPRLDETVFFHRRSNTLICADLVFNIQRENSWLTRLVLRMAGAYQRLAQSRLWRFATKDRDAVRQSVAKVLSWDVERIVMAHGEPVETDARAALTAALWWMRGQPAIKGKTRSPGRSPSRRSSQQSRHWGRSSAP